VKQLILVILTFACGIGCSAGPDAGSVKKTMVPMRDGVRLATMLYFPESGKAPFSTVLVRTSYGEQSQRGYGRFFSQHGYVVAVQNVRGTNGSEGKFRLWVNEKDDGYDAVEWLAAQEWSNGKIGMIGGSYSGWVQLATAVAKPPHLVTIIPRVTMGDPFFNHVYPYGMFALTHIQAVSICEQYAGIRSESGLPRDWKDRLFKLPVIDLDRELLGGTNEHWREHLQHAVCDSYWRASNVLEDLESLSIPVFLQGGWFDFGGIGTKLAYQHLENSDCKYVKLLIGPWLHSGKTPPGADLDWGSEAEVDFMPLFLRWFDTWMQGADNGILDEASVRVFAVGPNRWLESNAYPLPGTSELRFYLSSGGGANTSGGDGDLRLQEPAGDAEFDSYVYDPADPTPSLWYDALADYESNASSRSDILVYESDALAEPLMVMGPVSARIHASSSARDTDWVVYWRVVNDRGEATPLGRGTLRARFRNSPSHPELLTEDQIYEYTIDLWHMGIQIERGWRIRLEVASACFPSFSRNLNTGGNNEIDTKFVTARQRIFHSRDHASYLALPVVDVK
jgi:putative CocE/NonD family hydrolase